MAYDTSRHVFPVMMASFRVRHVFVSAVWWRERPSSTALQQRRAAQHYSLPRLRVRLNSHVKPSIKKNKGQAILRIRDESAMMVEGECAALCGARSLNQEVFSEQRGWAS